MQKYALHIDIYNRCLNFLQAAYDPSGIGFATFPTIYSRNNASKSAWKGSLAILLERSWAISRFMLHIVNIVHITYTCDSDDVSLFCIFRRFRNLIKSLNMVKYYIPEYGRDGQVYSSFCAS